MQIKTNVAKPVSTMKVKTSVKAGSTAQGQCLMLPCHPPIACITCG